MKGRVVNMAKTNWKFYFTALGILLALSAYPVFMGLKIVVLQLMNGSAGTEDYARYVVPYSALCFSVLVVAAFYPLLARIRRITVLVATVLALALFTGAELYMESITISDAAVPSRIASVPVSGARGSTIQDPADKTALNWQLYTCIASPDSVKAFRRAYANDTPAASAVGRALRQDYNNSFKIHYFLVAFVLIALITGLVYGYGRAFSGGGRAGRKPLHMQLAATILLLGFCVFANFTGFFRGTQDYQPPLPSLLTGLFFVILGAAGGIYLGSRLMARGFLLSVLLPAVAAAVICSVMYFGEFKLLGGTLYRFGASPLFQGLPGIAVAPVDILVILLSAAVTALVMRIAGKGYQKEAALS